MTEQENYQIGDTVLSPIFGKGVILPAQEEEGYVTVQFEGDAGVKHLSLQYANLQKVTPKSTPLKETEFIMQYYIKVSHDPSPIDETESPDRFLEAWRPLNDLEKHRFHRMYQTIIHSSLVLRRILLFCAFAEQDYRVEGSVYGTGEAYVDHVFKTGSFVGLLLQHIASFQPNDQQWLREVTVGYLDAQKRYKQIREELTDDEYTEEEKEQVIELTERVEQELDHLERCFKAEYSGWDYKENMEVHKHQ